MKNIRAIATRTKSITTRAGLTFIALLAAAFWFATSPLGLAQGGSGTTNTCSFCHKKTVNMSLPCDSFDYRRHLDHGDTVGACVVTPTDNP